MLTSLKYEKIISSYLFLAMSKKSEKINKISFFLINFSLLYDIHTDNFFLNFTAIRDILVLR